MSDSSGRVKCIVQRGEDLVEFHLPDGIFHVQLNVVFRSSILQRAIAAVENTYQSAFTLEIDSSSFKAWLSVARSGSQRPYTAKHLLRGIAVRSRCLTSRKTNALVGMASDFILEDKSSKITVVGVMSAFAAARGNSNSPSTQNNLSRCWTNSKSQFITSVQCLLVCAGSGLHGGHPPSATPG